MDNYDNQMGITMRNILMKRSFGLELSQEEKDYLDTLHNTEKQEEKEETPEEASQKFAVDKLKAWNVRFKA
jgi:hypothetical protein